MLDPVLAYLPNCSGTMCLMRHWPEHFIRLAELRSRVEHLRMMQQRAIEHAMTIDHQPIVDVKPRVEHRAIHMSELGMLARRSQARPWHFTNQLPMHRIGDPILR